MMPCIEISVVGLFPANQEVGIQIPLYPQFLKYFIKNIMQILCKACMVQK